MLKIGKIRQIHNNHKSQEDTLLNSILFFTLKKIETKSGTNEQQKHEDGGWRKLKRELKRCDSWNFPERIQSLNS